jgi:hypothetical protein
MAPLKAVLLEEAVLLKLLKFSWGLLAWRKHESWGSSCIKVENMICVVMNNEPTSNRMEWESTIAMAYKQNGDVRCFPRSVELNQGPLDHCDVMWRKVLSFSPWTSNIHKSNILQRVCRKVEYIENIPKPNLRQSDSWGNPSFRIWTIFGLSYHTHNKVTTNYKLSKRTLQLPSGHVLDKLPHGRQLPKLRPIGISGFHIDMFSLHNLKKYSIMIIM